MKLTSRKRKTLYALTIIAIIVLPLYGFFGHTVKGQSLVMYTALGWGAPVSTRVSCATQTNKLVDEKFLLPLDFDKVSKNALREFWHFSYYKECLFHAGYTSGGDSVPASTIEDRKYTNHFAGIEFTVPDNTALVADNILDVDYDSRLYRSEISTDSGTIFISTYNEHNDFITHDDVMNKLEHLSTTDGNVIEKESLMFEDNLKVARMAQDDDMSGFVFITPESHVIHLFGPSSSGQTLSAMISTLKLR